jgi:hypothetical protein
MTLLTVDSTCSSSGSPYTDDPSNELSELSEPSKRPAVGLEEALSLEVILADGEVVANIPQK